jgi:hypothetical protein
MIAEEKPYVIVKTKYGPAHGLPQGDGRIVTCQRRATLCKYCKEDGVPLQAPDPFDALADRLRKHWDQRWFEMNRLPVSQPDNVINEGVGVHIVARDAECRNSTVLVSFGDDPAVMLAVSALVHIHNEMVGQGA